MAKVHQIYRQLQRLEDVTVDRAMVAALPTADRLALRLMGLLLLHRRHPDGLLGLVMHFHLFSPDIQHIIASHARDMFRPLRQAAATTHGHGPLNAIQIIHRSLNARLAYLASDQLRTGSSEAQCAAGACLLHLARHAASDPRPGVMPQIEPMGVHYLQLAIDEAVDAYRRHEQRSALVATAWLLLRGSPAVRQALADPRHVASAAMAELVDEGDQPAIVRHLILFMRIPLLADAAITGLGRAADRGQLGPMLGQYHLLAFPGVRAALGRIEQPSALCLNEAQARLLPPHESRGLGPWIAVLPLERSEKIQRLARLRKMPDPPTRLLALRRLVEISSRDGDAATPAPHQAQSQSQNQDQDQEDSPGEGSLEAIALFCDDPDPQFARIALHHLIRRRYTGLPRLLMRLINSHHPSLRRHASQHLGPIGFKRLWEAWPRLDEHRQLAAGRALLKIDSNFQQALREKLHQSERTVLLRALNMTAVLQQGAAFEPTLRKLAEGPDEVIASAAVKALGSAGSDEAIQSLEKAMRHADTRVRANAVEALGQVRTTRDLDRHVERLTHMAEDEANRPRANAIGTMLGMKAGDALGALTRMLEDERPEHRISALWLVERMGVLEAARTVTELSATDPDPNVRRRAEKIAREMLELSGASMVEPALEREATTPAGSSANRAHNPPQKAAAHESV